MRPVRWWLAGPAASAIWQALGRPGHCLPLDTATALQQALAGGTAHLSGVCLLGNEWAQADPVDTAMRALLAQAACPYSVVYPHADGWATPVAQWLGLQPAPTRPLYSAWPCDSCSDPVCEHRLFTGLVPPRAP
jgi:hypothetical protein